MHGLLLYTHPWVHYCFSISAPPFFACWFSSVSLANELLSTDPRRAEAWVVLALYSEVLGDKEKATTFVDKVRSAQSVFVTLTLAHTRIRLSSLSDELKQ